MVARAILAAPHFYTRVIPKEESPVCVCQSHDIIIVCRTGPGDYWMYTDLVDGRKNSVYLHHWRNRTSDPPCLKSFEASHIAPLLPPIGEY